MELKVTCTCGIENHVTVTKKIASQTLSAGRKLADPAKLRDWGSQGGKKRWEGHVKKTNK